jgi:hypothetical protein
MTKRLLSTRLRAPAVCSRANCAAGPDYNDVAKRSIRLAERAKARVGGILMLDFVARLHGTIVLVGHARELGGSRWRAATVRKEGR